MNGQATNGQPSPKYWWLLSESDRVGYSYIRSLIMNNPESNQRNKRLSTFLDIIEMIRRYAVRGDSGDANRCLVCGILWLPGAIAINTHQLGFLMDKCKSSINGCFQILGYQEKISRKSASDLVGNKLSMIHDDRSELRKWTVRCMDDSLLEISSQTIAQEIASKPERVPSTRPPHQKETASSFQTNNAMPSFAMLPPPLIPQQVSVPNPLCKPQSSIRPDAFQLMPQPINQEKKIPQVDHAVKADDKDQTVYNYEFPIPLKKGLVEKSTEKDDNSYMDLFDSNFDFSKEDAIISSALNEDQNNSTDYWNIEMMTGDFLF